jgi:pilus assembly protein FimV
MLWSLSSRPTTGVHKLIAKSYRWQKIATAMVATAFFSLLGFNAAAFSLGRITIQSALGEPLRAEIEVLDINAEEANSFKTSVALPQAFKAAGLDYNPVLAGLQATLQKRADGRSFIRLSSELAINDPFVDIILEANWASGRIVRDYTLLIDPQSRRPATPVAATAPSLSQVPTQPTPSRVLVPVPIAVVPNTTVLSPASKASADAPNAKAARTQTKQVSVKSGDTASQIAVETKPANISLDQMLVAMLRANPDAFMGANVNRIKAGSMIDVPSAEQAGATSADQATQIVIAQSKDFNDFRRKLAGTAPQAQVAAADRKTSGTVQAKVQDQKALTGAVNKLLLSKGSGPGQPTEDQIARERSAKAAANRAAEITKNINDLSKLGAASSVVAPVLPASVATPVNPVTQAASPAKPAVSAAVKRPLAQPVPPQASGLIDDLLENPLLPASAIGLIALLAGWGFYRSGQRKSAAQVDNSFLAAGAPADSFLGTSVDTNEGPATGSSMLSTPSQTDAADGVDPVAEADVYLAYGRDLQAEEILRDALHGSPERIAIYQKLLEIFAKRRDAKGFADIAEKVFKLTAGVGPDWQRVCELGSSIDPDNALYQVGAEPGSASDIASPSPADDTSAATDQLDLLATQVIARPVPASIDLDLDLDFSLDDEPASATDQAMLVNAGPIIAEPAPSSPVAAELDIQSVAEDDLPLESDRVLENTHPAALSVPQETDADADLIAPSDAREAPAQPAPGTDLSLLEFDLGSLSLDLEPPAPASTGATSVSETEDPLATKLALAQEFRAIGDDEGARSLIEEVIAEASGDMKIKAQDALSRF